MTLEEVVEAGRIGLLEGLFAIPPMGYAGVILMARTAAAAAGDVLSSETGKRGAPGMLVFTVFVSFGILMTGLAGIVVQGKRWEQEVACPYIASLPDERYELLHVDVPSRRDARFDSYQPCTVPEDNRQVLLTVAFRTGDTMETLTAPHDRAHDAGGGRTALHRAETPSRAAGR